jgi:ABC-type multidrug transport system fused ATPase/permease subunit
MILLFLILATTIALQLILPLIASRFIDRAVGGAPMRALIDLAMLTIVLALVAQVVAVVETWIAEHIAWSATNALRADLAAHLLRLDARFHNAHTPGELIERIDGDVGKLAGLFSRFTVYVLGNALLLVGILGTLVVIDWRIGALLALFVVLAVTIMLRIRAWAEPFSAAEREQSARFYGFIGEYVAAREDIRSSGAVPYVVHRFIVAMRAWLHTAVQAGLRGYAIVASSTLVFGIGVALALVLGGALYRRDMLTIGAVFLVFRYTQLLQQPISQIQNEIQDLQHAGASIGRIDALLAEQPRLADGSQTLPRGSLSVSIDTATFGYDPGSPVLRDVTLTIPAGRVLGIVGRTGSGKTTVTRLIPRFYDPDAGSVRIGGVDVRDVSLAALRARIGLVTQDVHLFAASLRENLTLFDPSIDDAQLVAALEDVGMGTWFRSLPAGLDSPIAAGSLSAGQTQVLACARILLRDPDIVLLDEPSSRLDPATERQVHRALGRLLDGRTGVLVAHRLSTFSYADDIAVMENGRVIEHGPRLILAADERSRYAALLRESAGEVLA